MQQSNHALPLHNANDGWPGGADGDLEHTTIYSTNYRRRSVNFITDLLRAYSQICKRLQRIMLYSNNNEIDYESSNVSIKDPHC